MKLTYYGHSACLLESETHRVLIDPFLKDNPLASIAPDQVKCDYIVLTHGHFDHIGDTVEIAKANDATVIAIFELAFWLEKKGCKIHPMGVGGLAEFPFGSVKFVNAMHSSGIVEEDGTVIYLGAAAGAIVKMENQLVYHMGDTGLFSDLKMIGEMHKISLALVPIGDNFTMGIHDAIEAVGWIQPKRVVPIHYNTFPYIEVDPQKFAEGVQELGVQSLVMSPGDAVDI